MQVLWQDAPATVQEVQKSVAPQRKLAYTTVQTMLNVLHRKRKVSRRLKNGAYRYRPLVSHRKAVGQAIEDVVNRVFDGSAESLVMSLVDHRHITPQKLAELQKILQSGRKGS